MQSAVHVQSASLGMERSMTAIHLSLVLELQCAETSAVQLQARLQAVPVEEFI
jgi:hypothetical protein